MKSCCAILLLSGTVLVLASCNNGPTQAFPSDKQIVESPECAQFTEQIGKAMDRQIAEDKVVEDRQEREFDNLMQRLNASGASEEQKSIAINNLTTRQDIENEARANRENNEIEAIRQKSQNAGCIVPKSN